MKNFIKKNKYSICLLILIIVGILVRTISIDTIPYGLNQDEASIGYEAYSLLVNNTDRHLLSYPVHLIAWGSGQNVLYAYLMIPFIKAFGLNEFTVRIPMAIIGCISLLIFYLLLKNNTNKKMALLGTFIFAICPWHIMKSRWGLEANIFPDLILYSTFFIMEGLRKNKNIPFYLGFIILGISTYSYGVAYMFLPIFILGILKYLLKSKKITLFKALLGLLTVAIIVLPLIAFVVINQFNLNEITIGKITIPRLYHNRYQDLMSAFGANKIFQIFVNVIGLLGIMIIQMDGLFYNALPFFGIVYIFSIIPLVSGLEHIIKNKFKDDELSITMFIWLIASFLLSFLFAPNINRNSITIIPIIYFTIKGLYLYYLNNQKKFKNYIIAYTVSFVLFLISYVLIFKHNLYTFDSDLKEPLQYIANIEADKKCITGISKEPYIYTLFYLQDDPVTFNETAVYNEKYVAFESIKSFKNYYFEIEETLNTNNAYMIYKENIDINDYYNTFKVTEFKKYYVLEPKK